MELNKQTSAQHSTGLSRTLGASTGVKVAMPRSSEGATFAASVTSCTCPLKFTTRPSTHTDHTNCTSMTHRRPRPDAWMALKLVSTFHLATAQERLLFTSRVAAGAVAMITTQLYKVASIDQQLIWDRRSTGSCLMTMTMCSERTLTRMCSSATGTNSLLSTVTAADTKVTCLSQSITRTKSCTSEAIQTSLPPLNSSIK